MDFQFLQNPLTKKWIVSAPRRAKRPDVGEGDKPVCPFCIIKDGQETEVYRVSAPNPEIAKKLFDVESDWLVRVINNKFPFAPIHEIVIHSPSHNHNFDELTLHQIELIIKIYRQRFRVHQGKGQVYIFHNRGERAGESLPHPHTQIVVIPSSVAMQIPTLDQGSYVGTAPHAPEIDGLDGKVEKVSNHLELEEMVETPHFYLFCPKTSEWPDETWMVPKKRNQSFAEVNDGEIADFSWTLRRLLQIFKIRNPERFFFNFYIYPGKDWYLRLIPRVKRLGGFEVGTGIYVNTQDPKETIKFFKEHFHNPNEELIIKDFLAEYRHGV